MLNNKEKCISPWFGLLVITIVCVTMGSAIFFQSSGTHHGGKTKAHVVKVQPKVTAAAKVAFAAQAANNNADTSGDKMVF